MKPKLILLITLLMVITLLTGCFGSRELNDLAMVMAVGIDKGSKKGKVKVTTQIALPANARGQTGSPSAGTGEPIWTATGEGSTIFEAIRNLGRFSSRRIFWAHNLAIVIGEDFVREDGLTDVIDFFTRNQELRMKTWVVVTPGKAEELVATKTGLEVIPGESIDKLFRYNELIAEAPKTDMRLITASYMSESTHPVIAKVQRKKRGISTEKPGEFGSVDQVELSGTAVFDKDKMVGWLSPSESRGLLWFIESVSSVVLPLQCPEEEKKPASVELQYNKFKVTPSYKNGKPVFTVDITTYGDLVELGCASSLQTSTIMNRLEKDVEKKIKKDIESVIKKAQETYKVDILKLGETFENRYPAEWKEIRSDWKEIFPNVQVKVNVNAEIKKPGLLQEPTKPMKD